MTTPANVDKYIAAFPREVQAVLQKVRQAVCNAAPDAKEVISYRMPALKQNGILVYFAAFKNHIGFYPPIKGDARLEKAASPYAGEKGNLRFPLDKPIPYGLIERLTKLRVKQDQAKGASRQNKTRPTDASVEGYLAAIQEDSRRSDCAALARLMTRITRQPPKMWGSSIVGFGSYHYKYASGREGDACLTGFSSRKGDISVYLVANGAGQEQLLAKLGRHKMAKSCLYIRRLSDVDGKVLERLIAGSVAEVRRRHG